MCPDQHVATCVEQIYKVLLGVHLIDYGWDYILIWVSDGVVDGADQHGQLKTPRPVYDCISH